MSRVINPKTKKYIHVNGPTYNQLVEEGYSKSYLNSLKNVKDLQLNLVTNEQVQYNDDVILMIIRYLLLNELFAFYHTNKHFHKLLNNNLFIDELNENYNVKGLNFMDFIHQIIYKKYNYNMNDLLNIGKLNCIASKYKWYTFNAVNGYTLILDCYHHGELISAFKTRRTTQGRLGEAKRYMRKEYAKEIDILSASKNNKAYEKNLSYLEYAIYYNLLKKI